MASGSLTQLLACVQARESVALEALFAAAYPELHRLAQSRLRHGGYSEREMADALGVTERTVQRDWEKARLILAAALG